MKYNEYDQTRSMISTIRKLNESIKNNGKLIREQEEQQNTDLKDDFIIINDVEVKMLSTDEVDLELSNETKEMISNIINSFRQQVSEIATLEPGMVMSKEQIRLDGNIDGSGFILIAGKDSGVYLNADMLMVTEEVFNFIDKLVKFHNGYEAALLPLIRERQYN